MSETFIKHDKGKPKISLVPAEAIEAIAEILTLGCGEYGKDNWKKCDDWSRIYDAAQRHLLAYSKGELIDPKWGKPHLYHALCNLAMLVWAQSNPTGEAARAQFMNDVMNRLSQADEELHEQKLREDEDKARAHNMARAAKLQAMLDSGQLLIPGEVREEEHF